MTSENVELKTSESMETKSSTSSLVLDPLASNSANASDAPLLALLQEFPRGFSTIEEGQKFVKRLQQIRLVPTTLKASLQEESNEIAKRFPKKKRGPTKQQTEVDDVLKGLI
jgi:hypothetical protein